MASSHHLSGLLLNPSGRRPVVLIMVQKTPNTQITSSLSGVATRIAAEDIRIGEYYALMSVTFEYPSFCWLYTDPSTTRRSEPVRITYRAGFINGPFRVKAICLPFVLVKTSIKSVRLLDVRNCQLARVDEQFARRVWKAERKQAQSSQRKSRKGKGKNNKK